MTSKKDSASTTKKPLPPIEIDDLIHYEVKGCRYAGIVIEMVGPAVFSIIDYPYGRSEDDINARIKTVFLDEVVEVFRLIPLAKKVRPELSA